MSEQIAQRVRSAAWLHPIWVLSVKASVAAMLAWVVVWPLGGFFDDYPYYAPLGALIAVSTSVVGSARAGLQAVLALLLGAALALGVQLLPLPAPLPLGIAIAAGTLVGGWEAVGSMGSWVPLAAMFVTIAGSGDPVEYTAAYAGLTTLGILIGIGVNVVVPQLPLTPAAMAQDRLRAALADQLDQLATALEEHLETERDWAALRQALARDSREAEDLLEQAREARRANWSAPRWARHVERRDARAGALQRLTGCVDDVLALVIHQRDEIRRDDPTAAELRSAAAQAFRSVAALLREGSSEDHATPASADRARDTVAALRERVARAQAASSEHHFAAAAITLNLEGAVAAWS